MRISKITANKLTTGKQMRKILLCIAILVLNSVLFSPPADCSSTESNIYPQTANKLESLELGQAILMLIPPAGTNYINWSYESNSDDIEWLDDTYKSNPAGTHNYRTGLMRINVEGVKSTILRKKKIELAWSVVYNGNSPNPNSGVQTIELKPGTSDGEGICFGSTFENCTFSPLESLARANIKAKVICKDLETTGLLLSAKGKKTIKAKWVTSGGAGGESSWLELLVNDEEKNICN